MYGSLTPTHTQTCLIRCQVAPVCVCSHSARCDIKVRSVLSHGQLTTRINHSFIFHTRTRTPYCCMFILQICMYVYTHTYIYTHVHAHTHTHTHTYIYIYIYMCMCEGYIFGIKYKVNISNIYNYINI